MNTTTTTPTLETSAMLVQLSISQWTARKRDGAATRRVARDYNASETAGNYNKALLPKDTALAAIHAKTGEIRNWYYENTLPWGLDGSRLLPANNFMAFSQQMSKYRSEWDGLVADFLAAYDQAKRNAVALLGNLYDPHDYPSADEVERKFAIDLAVFPVPTTDFRVQVGQEALAALSADVERRVSDAQAAAMADLWQRLYDVVEKLADKLADPKGIFRDTLVQNARDLCALLPRLNMTGDAKLEGMRQSVENMLAGVSPETLRRDETVRADTADAAADIMRQMGAFMGGL